MDYISIITVACKITCSIYSNIKSQNKMFNILNDASNKIGDKIDETILIKFRAANITLANLVLSKECYRDKHVLDKPEMLYLGVLGLDIDKYTGNFSNQELLALTYYGLFLIESIRNNNERLTELYILRAFETEYPLVYKEIFKDFFERVFEPYLCDLYEMYEKRLYEVSNPPHSLNIRRQISSSIAAGNSLGNLITGHFEDAIYQGFASYLISKNKMPLELIQEINNRDRYSFKIEECDYISEEDLIKRKENDICRKCAMLASQFISQNNLL